MTASVDEKPAAATPKELREMRRLLRELEDKADEKTIAAILARRPWLKRGIEAVEQYGLRDQCPQAERPFFDFFDRIHTVLHEKMVISASDRARGDARYWLDYLARLWRSEYGKWESGQQGGNTVIVVERPPRDE